MKRCGIQMELPVKSLIPARVTMDNCQYVLSRIHIFPSYAFSRCSGRASLNILDKLGSTEIVKLTTLYADMVSLRNICCHD
jgi:hypothetical protein